MSVKTRPAGFEPATRCLEGSCSSPLSYERMKEIIATGIPVCKRAGVAGERGALFPRMAEETFLCRVVGIFPHGVDAGEKGAGGQIVGGDGFQAGPARDRGPYR